MYQSDSYGRRRIGLQVAQQPGLEDPNCEKTLLGHIARIREWLQNGIIESLQWCDTRDTTADGHTKGSVDRSLLIELMSGRQRYRYDVKRHVPCRGQSAP